MIGQSRALWAILLAGLLSGSTARADTPDLAPDAEVAQLHFLAGVTRYNQKRYDEAIAEFRQAEKLFPSPKFSYNIALCYERQEAWGPAADTYERYLGSNPPDAEQLRARVGELRKRAAEQAAQRLAVAPPVEKPVHRRAWIAAVVVGVVLVAAGLTIGLTLGLRESAPQTTLGNSVVQF